MLDNLELYLASAALNGGKYKAAAEFYMKVAVRNDSIEGWVGMGLCQLYQLAAGRTMDEVIFCFNKAKSINPALQKAIEAQLIRSCQLVLVTYVTWFNEALGQEILANKKVAANLLLTGCRPMEKQIDCDQHGASVAPYITGTGVAPFKRAIGMGKLLNEVLLRFYEIEDALRLNVDLSSPAYLSFTQMQVTVLKIEGVQPKRKTKRKPIESVLAKKRLVVSR